MINHQKKLALTFSRPKTSDPLSFMGEKRPVYEELLSRLKQVNIIPFITTTKVYLGNGVFEGFWNYSKEDKCKFINKKIIVDLGYDRSAGLEFPPPGDSLRVVDSREFKILSWDKWLAYQTIGEFMAKTYLISNNLQSFLNKIPSKYVVIKPTNGLKGKNLFIGSKKSALKFKMAKNRSYILCEFIDTANGIPNITEGRHDLRVVVVNKETVWSHVRTPPRGSLKANVAQGGKLTEVDTKIIPESVLWITKKVAEKFYQEYDNPVYSLDFGIDNNGKAYIFEINDTIGFPKQNMSAKDRFIEELIKNFKMKLK